MACAILWVYCSWVSINGGLSWLLQPELTSLLPMGSFLSKTLRRRARVLRTVSYLLLIFTVGGLTPLGVVVYKNAGALTQKDVGYDLDYTARVA
jgi:hypothetical protein